MKICIIQARMSSNRLPGKSLMPIAGKPMLLYQYNRIKKCKWIDKIVIATSDQESDDPIAAMCRENKIECYRGSLDDVLDRFYRCAKKYKAKIIIRLTGDCPLAWPVLVDSTIKEFIKAKVDYIGNTTMNNEWPDGWDVEVMSFNTLKRAWQESKEREHVTTWIYKLSHTGINAVGISGGPGNIGKFSVDTQEDYERIKKIIEN